MRAFFLDCATDFAMSVIVALVAAVVGQGADRTTYVLGDAGPVAMTVPADDAEQIIATPGATPTDPPKVASSKTKLVQVCETDRLGRQTCRWIEVPDTGFSVNPATDVAKAPAVAVQSEVAAGTSAGPVRRVAGAIRSAIENRPRFFGRAAGGGCAACGR